MTYYIYDGERPIYEFDPSGGTPSTNVYGRGIDEIIARSNNGSGQYPMQDHEGSVIVVTGGDGTILESYRYDAFGTPTIYDSSHITHPSSLINNRFLFTGREYAPQFGFSRISRPCLSSDYRPLHERRPDAVRARSRSR